MTGDEQDAMRPPLDAIRMYDCAAIYQLERNAANDFGIQAEALMQQAASGALSILQRHYPDATVIGIVCGKGNNAGDGLVLAQLCLTAGLQPHIIHVPPLDEFNTLALQELHVCQDRGVPVQNWHTGIDWHRFDVIVDALLGIGIRGAPQPDYAQAIAAINEAITPVLALDVPSGVQGDSGHVAGQAIVADRTLTFLAYKQGLFTAAALDYVGTLSLHELNVPEALFSTVAPTSHCLNYKAISAALGLRSRNAHKGDFGHVVVVSGDTGMAGAAIIAAQGAARAGAGRVTVLTRAEHVSAVVAARPEVMCRGVAEGDEIQTVLGSATVIVVGPGLGTSSWSQWLWQQTLAAQRQLVVDASALELLARQPMQRDDWILTPHPGEASRLLQQATETIQSDRFQAIAALQEKYGGVVVLKGAGTLVQAQGAVATLCPYGNPGMASGGMGDLLAGIVAGLVAQRLPLVMAAEIGVLVHALSADSVSEEGERGILALDLLPVVRQLVNLASDQGEQVIAAVDDQVAVAE
jgi:ADP-dependent NAD(P)H-hydrate dehydratase / NAD(P)H-hydrate epimerase